MESRTAHLQMIQSVITRMASNSFVIKGWSVTLVTALLALTAAANANALFVYLAFFPNFMFWALDAYFLRQEILFRELYDHVRTSGEDVDFSMNTAPLMRHTKSTWSVALSHTLRLFHGTVTVIIVVASLVAMQAK